MLHKNTAISDILHKYLVHKDYLYKKCTDYCLVIFSGDMKEMKYLDLALYFGMSDADTQQIQKQGNTEKGRVISMLSRWKRRNGNNATYLALVSNFYQSGHCKVAESIIINLHKKYSKPMVSSVAVQSTQVAEFTPEKSKQYLTWHELPETKQEQIRNDLMEENDRVSDEFYDTLATVKQSFKDRKVDYLQIDLFLRKGRCFPMAKKMDRRHIDSLLDKYNQGEINGVFYVIGRVCSWFNYHLLDAVVSKFGSDDEKECMSDYVNKILWPYLQRSLYEIPPESIECQEIPSESYHFVYPINADDATNETNSKKDVTGQQIKYFQYLISRKLEIPMEEIHIQFKPGSIIVHFIVDKQLFAPDDVRLFRFVKGESLDTFQLSECIPEPEA